MNFIEVNIPTQLNIIIIITLMIRAETGSVLAQIQKKYNKV